MEWCSVCRNVDPVPVCHDDEWAETESEDVDFPADLRSYHPVASSCGHWMKERDCRNKLELKSVIYLELRVELLLFHVEKSHFRRFK